MPIVCLIGRHGSGKSTIGKEMRSHGYVHLSVGTLRRLAMKNAFPSDVPYTLMLMLKHARAGEPLSLEVAAKLLAHAYTFRNCVIDGFPSAVEHVDLCPADCVIGLVGAAGKMREDRLTKRGELTVRQWTKGMSTAREENLVDVALHARRTRRLIYVPNFGTYDKIPAIASNFVQKLTSRL